MIITETVELNGMVFTHNYSDQNLMIQKVGTNEVYCDAYDLSNLAYTYEETSEAIITNAQETVTGEETAQ